MNKALFSAIGFIFSYGPSFYYTDGPPNWVKFHKDISPDTCLIKNRKILYEFYICSGVWIITLKGYNCICKICTLVDRCYLVIPCECYDLPITN